MGTSRLTLILVFLLQLRYITFHDCFLCSFKTERQSCPQKEFWRKNATSRSGASCALPRFWKQNNTSSHFVLQDKSQIFTMKLLVFLSLSRKPVCFISLQTQALIVLNNKHYRTFSSKNSWHFIGSGNLELQNSFISQYDLNHLQNHSSNSCYSLFEKRIVAVFIQIWNIY